MAVRPVARWRTWLWNTHISDGTDDIHMFTPHDCVRGRGDTSVLDALAKLRKATISFVASVCPSFCPHGTTRLQLHGFSWNLISEDFFKNMSRKFKVSLQPDEHNWYCTWRHMCIYGNMSLSSSYNERCIRQLNCQTSTCTLSIFIY